MIETNRWVGCPSLLSRWMEWIKVLRERSRRQRRTRKAKKRGLRVKRGRKERKRERKQRAKERRYTRYLLHRTGQGLSLSSCLHQQRPFWLPSHDSLAYGLTTGVFACVGGLFITIGAPRVHLSFLLAAISKTGHLQGCYSHLLLSPVL